MVTYNESLNESYEYHIFIKLFNNFQLQFYNAFISFNIYILSETGHETPKHKQSPVQMPFTPEECLDLLKMFPPDSVVHNKFNCSKNCCSDLSLAEKSRILPKKLVMPPLISIGGCDLLKDRVCSVCSVKSIV